MLFRLIAYQFGKYKPVNFYLQSYIGDPDEYEKIDIFFQKVQDSIRTYHNFDDDFKLNSKISWNIFVINLDEIIKSNPLRQKLEILSPQEILQTMQTNLAAILSSSIEYNKLTLKGTLTYYFKWKPLLYTQIKANRQLQTLYADQIYDLLVVFSQALRQTATKTSENCIGHLPHEILKFIIALILDIPTALVWKIIDTITLPALCNRFANSSNIASNSTKNMSTPPAATFFSLVPPPNEKVTTNSPSKLSVKSKGGFRKTLYCFFQKPEVYNQLKGMQQKFFINHLLKGI